MEPQELNRLIRLAADDELSAAESIALEEYLAAHPEDRAAVAFEGQLRQAVGRAMSEPTHAPAGLRDEIEASLGDDAEAPAVVATIGRSQWYRPSGMVAGIVILIGVAAVWSFLSNGGMSSHLTPVAQYGKWKDDGASLGRDLVMTTPDEAQSYLQKKIGWANEVPDLTPFGFGFQGLTKIRSNGFGGVRVHLRYVATASPADSLTICIEKPLDFGEEHFASILEGHAYQGHEMVDQNRMTTECYLTWRAGDFLMCLIPCDGEARRNLAVAIGMPDVEIEQRP